MHEQEHEASHSQQQRLRRARLGFASLKGVDARPKDVVKAKGPLPREADVRVLVRAMILDAKEPARVEGADAVVPLAMPVAVEEGRSGATRAAALDKAHLGIRGAVL